MGRPGRGTALHWLEPQFALGYFVLDLVRIFIGHFVEALDALLSSLRLNPNDPQAGSFLSFVALPHYHQGNYDEAAHYGELAVRGRRAYLCCAHFVASLGQLGRIEEAKAILNELERKKLANADEYFKNFACVEFTLSKLEDLERAKPLILRSYEAS